MSRRRPTLGIGGAMSRTTVSHTTVSNNNGKAGGLSLIGAYADPDDESEPENTNPPPNPDSIDSKVFDFLKEIDSMDTEETPEIKNEESESTKEDKWGNWKKCIDEKTQHPYYWNTVTNKVTWNLPPEFTEQTNDETTKETSPEVVPATTEITDIKCEVTAAEPVEKSVKVGKVLSDSLAKKSHRDSEIDIDAELDNALEGKTTTTTRTRGGFHDDIFSTTTLCDIELDLLRMKDLPLSYEDTDVLTKKYREDIYRLEGEEERKRGRGSWSSHLNRIEDMRILIRDNKEKWKSKIKSILSHELRSSSVRSTESRQRRSRDRSTDRRYTSSSSRKERSRSKEPLDKKGKISKLMSTLLGRLDYLEVRKNNGSATLFKMLISIETRVKDWEVDEIRSSYLLKKLKESDEKMKNFESAATPIGWSCIWDSHRKRYIFQNDVTLETQSTFPDEDRGSEKRYDGGFRKCLLGVLNGKSSPEPRSFRKQDIADKLFKGSLSLKRHHSESPVVREEAKVKKTSSDLPPLPPQASLPPLPPRPPSPEDGEIQEENSDGGVTMDMSEGEVESTPIIVATGNMINKAQTTTQPTVPPLPAATTVVDKKKKVKKIKKKKAVAVAKPPKQLNSLVGRWQRAQQEMEEEEEKLIARSDSDEDDPRKKIEEWKLQEIISGNSSKNPNFEPVGDAWKSRIKKRVT